tara:strand:- start:1990 stop:2211 length:222 start_codon:yes stop_codon:yes gene_type:complete
MARPTRVEVNCTTGVTSIIDLTDAEIAEMEVAALAAADQRAAQEAEAAAKATAKAALLERMGLTADEAVLLLS